MNYVVLPENSNPDVTYMISKWYVTLGSRVKTGDALMAYEEDKCVVDVHSDFDGEIAEIYVREEEIVAPGTRVCAIV